VALLSPNKTHQSAAVRMGGLVQMDSDARYPTGSYA